MALKVYLAGPDVFYPDALERGRQMQELCASRGFIGLYPLDGSDVEGACPGSRGIFEANIQLIASADALVANLRDFRGHEPDSGTVWEVAYALAIGKPVVGYLPSPESVLQRVSKGSGAPMDAQGCAIENFGLPLNLMLAHSLTSIVYGPEEGFAGLKAALSELSCIL
jgi:nucleoside 2-deoxyribosyltransferase